MNWFVKCFIESAGVFKALLSFDSSRLKGHKEMIVGEIYRARLDHSSFLARPVDLGLCALDISATASVSLES
jgi:hypothetical protein